LTTAERTYRQALEIENKLIQKKRTEKQANKQKNEEKYTKNSTSRTT
jgi:hypothetical protein